MFKKLLLLVCSASLLFVLVISTPVAVNAEDLIITTSDQYTPNADCLYPAFNDGLPYWSWKDTVGDGTGSIGPIDGVKLIATGGTGSYTWSVISGQLPHGLQLSTTGWLHGTPLVENTYTFTVRVSDGVTNTDKQMTMMVFPRRSKCFEDWKVGLMGGPFVWNGGNIRIGADMAAFEAGLSTFNAATFVQEIKNVGINYMYINTNLGGGDIYYPSTVPTDYNRKLSRNLVQELVTALHNNNMKAFIGINLSSDTVGDAWTQPFETYQGHYVANKIAILREVFQSYPVGGIDGMWVDGNAAFAGSEGTNALWQLMRVYQPFAVGLDNHTVNGLYPQLMNNNDKRFTDIVNDEAPMNYSPATTIKFSENINGFYKPSEVEQPIEYSFQWDGPGNETGIRTSDNLIQMMVKNASIGANYMLAWGVEQEQYGTYISYAAQPYRQILNSIGDFLNVNGDSIYGTRAGSIPGGKYPNNAEVYSTKKAGKEFLHLFSTKLLKSLSRSGWTSTASSSYSTLTPDKAIDEDLTSRWTTGVYQTNGQWFMIDMGATKTFNRIIMDSGSTTTDYPRGYEVYVSNDGANWGSAIATGTGSSAVTEVTFNVSSARYIKIVQTGSSSSAWWSIHDFRVYNSELEVPLSCSASRVYLVRNGNDLSYTQSGGILSVTLGDSDFDPNGFDTVIGVEIPNKIDPDVTITASTYLNLNFTPQNALDGIKGVSSSGEWASNGETTPWIKYDWGTNYKTIDKAILYDRQNATDNISAGRLDFSDGSNIIVGALPNDGTPLTVEFDSKSVSWVNFTVTAGQGLAVGLSEMEVINSDNIAPDAKVSGYGDGGVTASSYYNANLVPLNTIDGIKSEQYGEWASNSELTPWIKFDFGSQYKTLNKVILYDRADTIDNINSGRLDFSDGTSVNVGALPADGSPLEVSFSSKSVTWVKFTVLDGEGYAVGLSEVEFEAPTNIKLSIKDFVHAVDGVRDINKLDLWDLASVTPWIKLDYNQYQTIDQVVLYARPNAGNISSGILDFSDGSSINVGSLPTSGAPLVVSFSGRTINWVKYTITDGSGLVGLNNIELIKKENLAKRAKPTVSSVLDRESNPLDISDTFSDSTLHSHWSWIREDNTKWSLTTNPGYMTMSTQYGGIEGAAESAKNILLKNSLGDNYSIETKVSISPTQDYQQAGLMMYKDDDNFIKLTKAYITNAVKLQFAKEVAGTWSVIASIDAPAGADVYLKMTKTGNSYNAYYSTDSVSWTFLGNVITDLIVEKDGLVAFNAEVTASSIDAKFDYLKTSSFAVSDLFNNSDLAGYWSWIREDNAKWSLTTNPGYMTMSTQYGGIEGTAASAKNILLKNSSGYNYSVETKVSISPTQDYQQAGLIMYKDDDNFIKLTKGYITNGIKLQFAKEELGVWAPIATIDAPQGSDVYLKINKYDYKNDKSWFDAYYSTDGVSWTLLGSTTSELRVQKDGLIAFNAEVTASSIDAKFNYLKTTPLTASDSFNGSMLADYWSWIREDNTKWSLTSNPGCMTITTQYGGIEGTAVSAKNLLLKNYAGGIYSSIETKVNISPTQDYQQAGLILYKDDDNFIKLTKGYITNGVKLQFAKEVAGAWSAIATIDAPAGADVYLRITKLTNQYQAFYSTDGNKWTLLGETLVDMAIQKDGVLAFNAEVNASSTDAEFEYVKTNIKMHGDFLKAGGPKADAFKVIEGNKGIADFEEWNSNYELTPWVELDWTSTQAISSIVLYDKVNITDNVLDSRLEFSDGTSINVGSLPNNGSPKVISFTAKNVTWIKYVVTKGQGTSVGLNEIEVY